MKLTTLSSILTVALAVLAFSPSACFAQQDPETAARQAEIDADEAQSKIESLEEEQVAAGDVQNETTAEMSARDNQISQYQDQ